MRHRSLGLARSSYTKWSSFFSRFAVINEFHFSMLQASWDVSLLEKCVDVLVLEEEWWHLPGDYSEGNLAFNVEERDWAEEAHSDKILLLGYPEPISPAPFLCDISFLPGSLYMTDELFQDSWAILVELEGDAIQHWGTAGVGFVNKLQGLIQPSPPALKRVSGSSNGGTPSIGGVGLPSGGLNMSFWDGLQVLLVGCQVRHSWLRWRAL